MLDRGEIRVAEKIDGEWTVHEWTKKAVLLSFRLRDNELMRGGVTHFFDKVPLKFAGMDEVDLRASGRAGGCRPRSPDTAPTSPPAWC